MVPSRAARQLPTLILLSDAALIEGRPGAEERWFDEVLPAVLEAARPQSLQVQLRHKQATAKVRLRRAHQLRSLASRFGQSFVVNDRLDIALVSEADGVHLPERGVSVEAARRLLGSHRWVSRAWHGEPIERGSAPPDAWLLSPVVQPRKGRPALGLRGLREAIERARAAVSEPDEAPVYALGGVTAESAAACLEAGARGVVVVGAAVTMDSALELLAALELTV